MEKVITRIKGGLGNQMFIYAASRRLALVNNAELVIDDVTGFARDYTYKRSYMLDHFNIKARKATPAERLEPFERYRRGVKKYMSRPRPFDKRSYLEQEGIDFDERLLNVKVKGTLYLDGYWQSEKYFKDIEDVVREDLKIQHPSDDVDLKILEDIHVSESVAIHVRWFDGPDSPQNYNVTDDYYERALNIIQKKTGSPKYFVFSDNLESAKRKLNLPEERTVFVSTGQGSKCVITDLSLMSQCKHFIIANSTFSWWGAWLGTYADKMIIAPARRIKGVCSWGFLGLTPENWMLI
jgi:hypothetical protein